MSTYVLLTKYAFDAIVDPEEMGRYNRSVQKRIRNECPDVQWRTSYMLLGHYDTLDIFEAPDNETAAKVAVIVRSFGHATTEVWPAMRWDLFETLATSLNGEESAEPDHARDAEKAIEDEVDEAMVESFPASDPPSFNPQTD